MLNKLSKITPASQNEPQEVARNWYRDRYEAVVTQRNVVAGFAICCAVLVLITVTIIMILLPTKTVIPFVIQVDEESGVVETMDPKSQQQITADEALLKYFVVKFLRARESYDSNTLENDVSVVRLMSTRPIFREYMDEVVNPKRKSYYSQLGTESIRTVSIKSIQFLDASLASVRLSITQKRRYSTDKPTVTHHVALVKFEIANLDLTLEEMTVNPVGFRVVDYKLEEENLK